MIVCVCNNLSEDHVRVAARKGAGSPAVAYAKLGCEVHCGTCLCFAQEVIDDELRAASGRSNVVKIRSAA